LLLIFIGYAMGRAMAGRPICCGNRQRRFVPLANEDVGPYLNNVGYGAVERGQDAFEGALIF